MNTRLLRALFVIVGISLTPVAYAIGVKDVLPGPAVLPIPESVMLAFLGVGLLAIANSARRLQRQVHSTPRSTAGA